MWRKQRGGGGLFQGKTIDIDKDRSALEKLWRSGGRGEDELLFFYKDRELRLNYQQEDYVETKGNSGAKKGRGP